MSEVWSLGFEPTTRQAKLLEKIGYKAVARGLERDEFPLISVIDRIRAVRIPQTVIQATVHEVCEDSGLETQSYRLNHLRADLMSTSHRFTLRVIEREDDIVLPPIEKVEQPNYYFVTDVYPPLDEELPVWGYDVPNDDVE